MSPLTDKTIHGLAALTAMASQGSSQGIHEEPFGNEAVSSSQNTADNDGVSLPASPWVPGQIGLRQSASNYIRSLFPFLDWIKHYNAHWLASDVIAGMTVGAVVIPQGMAYASLAKLAPQFGLYSSFMGAAVYWIFGTSKDISIGPVAVLSTVVGTVVEDVISRPETRHFPPHVIASALSIVAGCLVLTIGLLRCGWIVDLLSVTSLSAFMTGSAITIFASQLPSLLGLTGFSHRDAAYRVVMHTLQNLDDMSLDTAVGLTALLLLYLIRRVLATAAARLPEHKQAVFLMSSMRTVFVISFYTVISFLVNRHRRKNPLFNVLGTIPNGFHSVAAPTLSASLVSSLGPHLPATVVVMLAEHIAISKSFGLANNYAINPSQEMVAIGTSNILGPFFGAYPSTGSFSRTAIQSKAGVRTPAASIITAVVVVLATIYLTDVFYYIPRATLAAVIIHAVGDLATPLDELYQLWLISPIEVLNFILGVVVSIFVGIEHGLYVTVAFSTVVAACRKFKARGRSLAQMRDCRVVGDRVMEENGHRNYGHYGTFEEV